MVEEIKSISDLKPGDIVFFMKPDSNLEWLDQMGRKASAKFQVGHYNEAIHVGVMAQARSGLEVVHITGGGYTQQNIWSVVGSGASYYTDHISIMRFDENIAANLAAIASDSQRFKRLSYNYPGVIESFFSGHFSLDASRDFTKGQKISDQENSLFCSQFIAAIYKEATNKLEDQNKRLNISSKCLPSQLFEEFDKLKESKLIYFSSENKHLERMLTILNSNIKRMMSGNKDSIKKAKKIESIVSHTLKNLDEYSQLEKIIILFSKIEETLSVNTGLTNAEPTSYRELKEFIYSLGLNPNEVREQSSLIFDIPHINNSSFVESVESTDVYSVSSPQEMAESKDFQFLPGVVFQGEYRGEEVLPDQYNVKKNSKTREVK